MKKHYITLSFALLFLALLTSVAGGQNVGFISAQGNTGSNDWHVGGAAGAKWTNNAGTALEARTAGGALTTVRGAAPAATSDLATKAYADGNLGGVTLPTPSSGYPHFSAGTLVWDSPTTPATSIGTTFVYEPSGTSGPGVYTSWSLLVTAANALPGGPVVVFFDCSHVAGVCVVPSGAWVFTSPDVTFEGPWSVPVDATVNFANGATLSGVNKFDSVALESTSTSPVYSVTNGQQFFRFENAGASGSSSAPFFNVTGSGTQAFFEFHFFGGLGDSTHAAISTGTGASSLVSLLDGTEVTANFATGTGPTIVDSYSPATRNLSTLTTVLQSIASNVGYTDSSPLLGSSQVQGAIDALKGRVSPGGAIGTELVFQPGGTAGPGVFTSWPALMTAASSVVGNLDVVFDGSHNSNAATIPSGAWAFNSPSLVRFRGQSAIGGGSVLVTCVTGATLSGVTDFEDIRFTSTSTAPVMTASSGVLLVRLRGTAQLTASASAPLILATGTATAEAYVGDSSILGDGTNPVISANGVNAVANPFIFAHGFVFANAVGGTAPAANLAVGIGSEGGSVGAGVSVYYVGPNPSKIVFQPGGTTESYNVFNSWSQVVNAANASLGSVEVFFDCSLVSNVCTIPAGTWSFNAPYVEFNGTSVSQFTTNYIPVVVTVSNGATLTGVSAVRRITLTSASTAPVMTSTGTQNANLELFDLANLFGSSSAPFVQASGTSSYRIQCHDGSTVGDSVHVAASTSGSTAQVFVNLLTDGSLAQTGCVSGTGAVVQIFDAAAVNNSGVAAILQTHAANLGYNDGLFTPATGSSQVQGAIDWFKTHAPTFPSAPGAGTYVNWTGTSWAATALPTSLPPNGTAGGRLAGTYPNPTLAASGVTAATYGSASQVPVCTVSADGTLSSCTNTTISASLPSSTGTLPSGALVGAYPSLTVAGTEISSPVSNANQACQTLSGGDVSGSTCAPEVDSISGPTVIAITAAPILEFSGGISSPIISQAIPGAGVSGGTITFQGQGGGSGNTAGGEAVVRGGVPSGSGAIGVSLLASSNLSGSVLASQNDVKIFGSNTNLEITNGTQVASNGNAVSEIAAEDVGTTNTQNGHSHLYRIKCNTSGGGGGLSSCAGFFTFVPSNTEAQYVVNWNARDVTSNNNANDATGECVFAVHNQSGTLNGIGSAAGVCSNVWTILGTGSTTSGSFTYTMSGTQVRINVGGYSITDSIDWTLDVAERWN